MTFPASLAYSENVIFGCWVFHQQQHTSVFEERFCALQKRHFQSVETVMETLVSILELEKLLSELYCMSKNEGKHRMDQRSWKTGYRASQSFK